MRLHLNSAGRRGNVAMGMRTTGAPSRPLEREDIAMDTQMIAAPGVQHDPALQALVDKDAIRDLVLLYSRAIDRQDIELLADLYTKDATDSHGDSYDGPAEGYCRFIANSFPHMPYSGHHVCNHMVSVAGDEGNGEVYALAYHLIPDQTGNGEPEGTSWRCAISTTTGAAPTASGVSASAW